MIDGTNLMDHGHTTRRCFLRHLGFGALAVALRAGTSGDTIFQGTSQGEQKLCSRSEPLPETHALPLPEKGLYVLTEAEVLHLGRVGEQIQLLHRVEHQVPRPDPQRPITYRVVVEGEPPLIYTNSGSELRTYDANLAPLARFSLFKPFYDFGVRQGFLYALIEGGLLVAADLRGDLKPVGLFPFPTPPGFPPKPGHHLLIRDRYAYVLDNILLPVFVHLIDLGEPTHPIIHTYEWQGVYPALIDQDLRGDRWYVLWSMQTGWGGSARGQSLTVLTASPPPAFVEGHRLPGWASPPRSADEGFFWIKQIRLLGDGLLLAAGIESRDDRTESGHVVIGALELRGQEPARLLSRLCLPDYLSGRGSRASELLQEGSVLYLAGGQGVYVIDAADPQQLRLMGLLPTASPALSLAWP
jgi:hypothetical protein